MLINLLQDSMKEILEAAEAAMERTHLKGYEKAGKEQIHQRLKALYVLTVRGVKERNVGPMIAHAETIAQERFGSGFDISEVQTAFNVLEEAIWRKILKGLPPIDFGQALGLVSTVLGSGKTQWPGHTSRLPAKPKPRRCSSSTCLPGLRGHESSTLAAGKYSYLERFPFPSLCPSSVN